MFFRKKKHRQEQTYKSAYQAFFGLCMRYCRKKEEAKEVFNDAMLKFFDYESKHKVNDEGRFSLIKKIIVNKCIDHVRRKKIEFENIEDDSHEFGQVTNQAEFNLIKEEMLHKVQNFPPQTRVIFNLYVFEGWSHEKIAESLGISINTSGWHVSQGKKQILNLLNKPNLI